MKKETLLEIILGTIGGILFAIGMCMCLIIEWNMLIPGIVVGVIGFIILLGIIPVYRRSHPKKERTVINKNMLITWIIGIIGALVMGFGMSRIMTENTTTSDMMIGLVTGVVGLVVCILNYPIYAYIKGNK